MAHRNRSPQEQADEFLAANKRWGVVAGSVIHHRFRRTEEGYPVVTGSRWKLENNQWYHIGAAALKLLPEGFPRWKESGYETL